MDRAPEAPAADRPPPAALMSPPPSRPRVDSPPEPEPDPRVFAPADQTKSPPEPASRRDTPAGHADTDFRAAQLPEGPLRLQPAISHRAALPAPLLPERKWSPSANPSVDFAQRFPPPAMRRTEGVQTAPPEITIHISRIDLRHAPEPPAEEPKPRRETKVTALGDYLKGKGG